MNRVSAIVVSGAVACLAGCTTPRQLAVSEPVGPVPMERAKRVGDTSLQVYSARIRRPADMNREEFLWNNDAGRNNFLYEPAHTDYTIYRQNGSIVRRVRNARVGGDPQPTLVSLPAGRYNVVAYARGFGLIAIPVVVERGKRTVVNLQRFPNPLVQCVPKDDAVCLADGRIVGWRADVLGRTTKSN